MKDAASSQRKYIGLRFAGRMIGGPARSAADEDSSGICEISITEVERRCTGTVMPLQDVYIAYQVESVIREPSKTPYIVWRRYRDFEYLHSHLQGTYRYVVTPPLPEKKVQFRWQKLPTDTLDPEFVERRRASLETFLRRVAGHPELSADRLFGEFLRHEASWRDDHSTVASCTEQTACCASSMLPCGLRTLTGEHRNLVVLAWHGRHLALSVVWYSAIQALRAPGTAPEAYLSLQKVETKLQ
ncbi:hypothetical protein HPB49_026135 [Dermacentor silvarum]|nr:hypothetical protein HPB49_026135 [Dermacentor silvarum]